MVFQIFVVAVVATINLAEIKKCFRVFTGVFWNNNPFNVDTYYANSCMIDFFIILY